MYTGLLTCTPGRTEKLEMLKTAPLCLWKFIYTWKSLSKEFSKKGKKGQKNSKKGKEEKKEEKREKEERKKEKKSQIRLKIMWPFLHSIPD